MAQEEKVEKFELITATLEDEEDGGKGGAKKAKKGKKSKKAGAKTQGKNKKQDDYDFSDGFIDDTDLDGGRKKAKTAKKR